MRVYLFQAKCLFAVTLRHVPGISSDMAWCAVISSHSLITFWLIHHKKGSLLTWDDDGGKYDGMTYWEQVHWRSKGEG